MSCEDCAEFQGEIRESLDAVRTSQIQTQAKVDWIVETVTKLMEGFNGMINAGGPLAMLKELRKGKKDG